VPWLPWLLCAIESYFESQSLCIMCTLCIGGILVSLKKPGYQTLATTNLKYSSRIVRTQGSRVCWQSTILIFLH
jgi:hypothetical protein